MLEALVQAAAFLSIGQETTSSAIACCLHELAWNPESQEKLQKEIDEVSCSPGGLSYESLFEMKYLDMVLCGNNFVFNVLWLLTADKLNILWKRSYFAETLRKHAGNAGVDRVCNEEFNIPGSKFWIPKGMRILIPMSCLHFDSEIYPEPEKFDPLRFTEENKAKRHAFTYLPFGEGPRHCIGKQSSCKKCI